VRLRGRVEEVNFLGSVVRVRVALGTHRIALDQFNNAASRPPRIGEAVEIGCAAEDVLVLEA
jgi:putative spermidine/putrescine transport system ATP-binding protein